MGFHVNIMLTPLTLMMLNPLNIIPWC